MGKPIRAIEIRHKVTNRRTDWSYTMPTKNYKIPRKQHAGQPIKSFNKIIGIYFTDPSNKTLFAPNSLLFSNSSRSWSPNILQVKVSECGLSI